MKTKHTPSPWILNYPHPQKKHFMIGTDVLNGTILNAIAHVLEPIAASGEVVLDEQESNAKLIAAAPELLEALNNIVEKLSPHFFRLGVKKAFSELVEIEAAKAVIKKATE